MKGILLAGGNGTRLRPLTYVSNKQLLPVYNKPMVNYPLETLKALGVTDIAIISSGEAMGTFIEYLGDGSKFGVKLTYLIQPEPLGIAHAIGLCEDFVGKNDVAVVLGDNIFNNEVIREKWFDNVVVFKDRPDNATLFVKEVEDPQRFGVATIESGRIVDIEEKPELPLSNTVVTGLYIYPPDVFEVIKTLEPSARGEYEITDVNNHYVQVGRCDSINLGQEFWSDAGTFDSLLKATNWVAKYESSKEAVG